MSTETPETHTFISTASGEPEAAPAPEKEAQAETPAVEPEKSEEDEQETHTEESATSDGKNAPAKANRGPRKRIDELTWQKHEALRLADQRERENQELRKQLEAAHPKYDPTTGPTLAECNWNEAELYAARDRWVREQAVADVQKQIQAQEQERQTQERVSQLQTRIEAFEAENPGAWQAATTAPINYTDAMQEVVMTSDVGPQIAFYLSQHLDEADSISRMSPYAAAAAMVRLETKLTAPAVPVQPPKPVTKAPAPPATLNPGAPVKSDWAGMSTEEHVAAYRAKKQARG